MQLGVGGYPSTMLSNTFFLVFVFFNSRSIFIKKHDSGINLLISHLARGRVENIEFQLIRPPILCQCAAVKAQRRLRSTHCDHDEESKHHAQHDVQIIGQASSPQRTQNGGQASDGASHTLAEPCRHSSQMQSSFWVVGFFFCFIFLSLHCTCRPCVFSAVTLEKSDTWDTATKGSPSSCRNTPMTKAVSSHL